MINLFLLIQLLSSSLVFSLLFSEIDEVIVRKFINYIVLLTSGKGKDEYVNDVPLHNYEYIDNIYVGKKYNPFYISQTALSYYKQFENGRYEYKQKFLNCADWLILNLNQKEDYAFFEYLFPFPFFNMKSPWRSGLAQGWALKVLVNAHKLTKNSNYLVAAKKIINSFYLSIDDGGVTYKEKNGWWYEEYACSGGKKPKVLNGMMYALLGIYDYYTYTKDDKSLFLFNEGISSLKSNLFKYDDNGYSYYDIYKNPADKYHKIHIELLNDLYIITHEALFYNYSIKWGGFKKRSFIKKLFKQRKKTDVLIFLINEFIILSLMLVIFLVFIL